MQVDPRVDDYIAKAPEFAQPILTHLRELVHKACPDVEETTKWSRPAFMYRTKILFGMAAFKAHCVFGFWQPEVNALLAKDALKNADSSGPLARVTDISELPPDRTLLGYVNEAVRLFDEGPTVRPKKRTAPKPELEMPIELSAALAKNKAAHKSFCAFSPSHRREYIEWISEAKRDETRAKRIATAIEWLAEGKSRNWKYANC